jgi:hypothetical protein
MHESYRLEGGEGQMHTLHSAVELWPVVADSRFTEVASSQVSPC